MSQLPNHLVWVVVFCALVDFMKAFAYMQNWEMVVQRADPNSSGYVDQMVVLGIFANEMGIPTVQEPRAVVKSKNA